MKAWIPLAGLAVLGAAALAVPLRHRVRLETAPGNPVQRIVLESRSLAGLTRTAWGVSSNVTVHQAADNFMHFKYMSVK